jgi:hypothetical protein
MDDGHHHRQRRAVNLQVRRQRPRGAALGFGHDFQPEFTVSWLEQAILFKQMQQASAMPTLAWRIKRRGMPKVRHILFVLVTNIGACPAILS